MTTTATAVMVKIRLAYDPERRQTVEVRQRCLVEPESQKPVWQSAPSYYLACKRTTYGEAGQDSRHYHVAYLSPVARWSRGFPWGCIWPAAHFGINAGGLHGI